MWIVIHLKAAKLLKVCNFDLGKKNSGIFLFCSMFFFCLLVVTMNKNEKQTWCIPCKLPCVCVQVSFDARKSIALKKFEKLLLFIWVSHSEAFWRGSWHIVAAKRYGLLSTQTFDFCSKLITSNVIMRPSWGVLCGSSSFFNTGKEKRRGLKRR